MMNIQAKHLQVAALYIAYYKIVDVIESWKESHAEVTILEILQTAIGSDMICITIWFMEGE